MYRPLKTRENVFKKKETHVTMDFPAWEAAAPPTMPEPSNPSLYRDMACRGKLPEPNKKDDILPDGWIRLSWDAQRRLSIQKNETTAATIPRDMSYDQYVSQQLHRLFSQWDEYKQNYIDLYGEDAYPNALYVSSASEDESETLEDEETKEISLND